MSGTRSTSSSRGGGRLPLVLMMLCCCAVVVAFPQFQDVIPNGHFVPCPPNVSGCVGEGAAATCPGVGHASCTGGSLPLNVFGAAFLNAKKAWTLELCMADRCAMGCIVVYKIVPPNAIAATADHPSLASSDGDGISNGEELADPCCHNTPISKTAYSHPGKRNPFIKW